MWSKKHYKRKEKRKNRSNEEDPNIENNKHFKNRGSSGAASSDTSDIVVSDILNETNNILYDGDNSVFHEPNVTSELNRTPEPEIKMSGSEKKMASNINMSDNEWKQYLMTSITDIKKGQTDMQKMFQSKLDTLKNDLVANMDTKIEKLKHEITSDMERESGRIDEVMQCIERIDTRLQSVEQSASADMDIEHNGEQNSGDPLSDTNKTVTVSGLSFSDGETPVTLAQELVDAIEPLNKSADTRVRVTAAKRLPSRITNDKRPPILKFSVESTKQKSTLLRHKAKLDKTERFAQVYIRSSKSRVEHLIESNARAVLRSLPQGRSLRVDASGRITKRNDEQPRDNDRPHHDN